MDSVPGARVMEPREVPDRSADHPGWDADTALEQLYAAHWRRLVRLSVLLVHDVGTAEEIVQDAFVAVHARWSQAA